MVEDVVEVGREVEQEPLRQLEVLADGEVGIEEPGPLVLVTALVRPAV